MNEWYHYLTGIRSVWVPVYFRTGLLNFFVWDHLCMYILGFAIVSMATGQFYGCTAKATIENMQMSKGTCAPIKLYKK